MEETPVTSTESRILSKQTEEQDQSASQGSSTSDYLKKSFCKFNYHPKVIKNKGALIVLLWNFLTVSVFHYHFYAGNIKLPHNLNFNEHTAVMLLAISTLFYPMAGWLADVHLGRYNIIRCSIWIMWTGFMVLTLTAVIAELHNRTSTLQSIIEYINVFVFIILTIGVGGFQANIIQFGVDQLLDASAREIIAFVRWYVWTVFGSGILLYFLKCTPIEYEIVNPLFVTFCLSLAICVDFCFSSKWLLKEPVTQNPFKLVRKVIAYAIKNKHPRMRSAFTYWEDKIPSRIDLAKVKYGGPFTTEQVEDVKTFFRMLVIIALGTISFSIAILVGPIQLFLLNHSKEDKLSCFKKSTSHHLHVLSVTIWIPLFEFIVFPVIQNFLPNITIATKFVLTQLLTLLSIILMMIVDQVGYHNQVQNTWSNNTHIDTCVFVSDLNSAHIPHKVIYNISLYWLALPNIIRGLSISYMFITVIEFICAQAPYSMKGFLLGTAYGMTSLVLILEFIIVGIPIIQTPRHLIERIPKCDFWALLTFGLSMACMTVVFLFVRKYYKTRKREDILPNEQMFAAAYYGN